MQTNHKDISKIKPVEMLRPIIDNQFNHNQSVNFLAEIDNNYMYVIDKSK